MKRFHEAFTKCSQCLLSLFLALQHRELELITVVVWFVSVITVVVWFVSETPMCVDLMLCSRLDVILSVFCG